MVRASAFEANGPGFESWACLKILKFKFNFIPTTTTTILITCWPALHCSQNEEGFNRRIDSPSFRCVKEVNVFIGLTIYESRIALYLFFLTHSLPRLLQLTTNSPSSDDFMYHGSRTLQQLHLLSNLDNIKRFFVGAIINIPRLAIYLFPFETRRRIESPRRNRRCQGGRRRMGRFQVLASVVNPNFSYIRKHEWEKERKVQRRRKIMQSMFKLYVVVRIVKSFWRILHIVGSKCA